jgi:hypothetical protein
VWVTCRELIPTESVFTLTNTTPQQAQLNTSTGDEAAEDLRSGGAVGRERDDVRVVQRRP